MKPKKVIVVPCVPTYCGTSPSCPNGFVVLFILINSVSCATCLQPYDFIVVGGGTGGLAVARRLAEGLKHTVLVLESGTHPRQNVEVPANAPSLINEPDILHTYTSVAQTNASLSTNGTLTLVCGRMLGGTSSLNYMHFNRGSPRDYNSWANSTGDPRWRYSNLLPYFKRIESYAGEYRSDEHGYTGPVVISRPNYAPGLKYWLDAGRSLGYRVMDPNGPQQISFSKIDFSKKRGKRASSYTAYIEPILEGTPNLIIRTNVNATQIVFSGKRAVGVRYVTLPRSGSASTVAYANKEIIISAGAYGSPLLLMRSGIGPRAVLEAANITIVQELPVGQNFHDHVSISVDFLVNTSTVVVDPARDFTPENLSVFYTTGDGPYSNSGGGTGQAFIASSVAKAEGEGQWADIQFTAAHSTESYLVGGNNNINSPANYTGSTEVPMSVETFLVRPKSRGNITLNAQDPMNGPPVIDFQHLVDPRDSQILLDGLKEAIRVIETSPSYQTLHATFNSNTSTPIPVCMSLPMRSDEFFKCCIKYLSRNGCHPAGSCKMGQGTNDNTAVVDSELRVIGIEGLRVADASVMPSVVNANTQVGVYVIAERASELILEQWKKKPLAKRFSIEGNDLMGLLKKISRQSPLLQSKSSLGASTPVIIFLSFILILHGLVTLLKCR